MSPNALKTPRDPAVFCVTPPKHIHATMNTDREEILCDKIAPVTIDCRLNIEHAVAGIVPSEMVESCDVLETTGAMVSTTALVRGS